VTGLVLLDGEIVPAAEARVPALSRAVLYGEGLFETLRLYGGRPFGLDLHLERLRRSATELDIPLPRLDGMSGALADLAARNGLPDGAARISVLAGEGDGGFASTARASHLLVTCRPLPPGLEADRRAGVAAATAPAGSTPLAAHKATAYLRSVRASRGAAAREVLLLDDDGRILEGAASNVFALTPAGLHTPPADGRILPGVTRALVLDIARDAGIDVVEAPLDLSVVRRSHGLFVSSSVIELLPVVTLDELPVAGGTPHGIVALLHRGYRALVKRDTGWDAGAPEPGGTTA
jgi:branched-subunit amino acid aminotransferase/4-amino-4-deoxychorismate lyase